MMSMQKSRITDEQLRAHPVVTQEQWLEARRQLLQREKALTHLSDEVNAARRALPWVRIDKPYRFEGPDGDRTLPQLFGERSQLLVYHFMFAPDWQEGCKGCSLLADHFDGANLHLAHHDVTLLAVSHAPWSTIAPFKRRMGWSFDWYSSAASDFNEDFHVSASAAELAAGKQYYNYGTVDFAEAEMPGISAFYRDAHGQVFHTYSSYARGLDVLLGVHHFLDMTPKGRNEDGTMDWVRHHDRYETSASKHDCCAH